MNEPVPSPVKQRSYGRRLLMVLVPLSLFLIVLPRLCTKILDSPRQTSSPLKPIALGVKPAPRDESLDARIDRLVNNLEQRCGVAAPIDDYEILRHWKPGGGFGADVLVPAKASKAEVLDLARWFRCINDHEPFLYVFIFDSRTAWAHRDDEAYPEKDYFRHFLATVMHNTRTGHDVIEWQAKNRGH